MFKNKKKKRNIIYLGILLLVVSLTIGFSAFQNELFINDMMLKVRLQRDVRVSDSVISKASNAVVNVEEFNKTKLLGNVTFDSTSSYVLYKVNLTNYGNVKSGLLKFGNTSGFNVSICDSNGSNCTTNYETAICNGSNCTLGSTKEIYVKVSPTSAGTKEINLDLDIEPYVNITYENVRENTSGFRTEILAGDTYQITLTSKPEEVEVSGSATVNYNKNTGVLTISEINSDLNIHAKYLINEIADYTYDGSDPDNYVRFNNELFRIVTKGDQDDGYGNFEYRTKIIKSESIGKYAFDTNGENEFVNSSLRTQLNTTYYDTLSNSAKELIDTWLVDFNNVQPFADYFGIIEKDDYDESGTWLAFEQFTLMHSVDNTKHGAIVNGSYVEVLNETELDTHPVTWLKTNVLIVGGSGTSSDPYILELSGSGLQPNPTVISGRTLTVTGSSQALVTVTNQVGTPYYSTTTQLNENNYSSGSTTIPTSSSVGNYTIYYYIPATGAYKAKTGSVHTAINGLTFTVAYQKGSNVTEIGASNDSCITTGSNLTCSVTLPTITPDAGYESVGWSTTNGDTTGTPAGTSYTLSSSNNNTTLYANAVVEHNYQNTTTLAYYGTLNEAFSAVQNNQTIKVLEDITETTNVTLASDKTGIMLDLNGKTITLDNVDIINEGSLDIYNTSSTNGTITSNNNTKRIITNNGSLTINGTSSTNKVIISSTSTQKGLLLNSISSTLTINNNVEMSSVSFQNGMTNQGNMTINNATITAYFCAIANNDFGTLTINGGTIRTTHDSLGFAVSNRSNLTINSGTIIGSYSGVHAVLGTTLIKGGTITAGYRGIFFEEGTLTLGTNDSSVSTASPVIETTNSSGIYAIYFSGDNAKVFNFYDGIIKSSSGSGYAFSNNPNNIPSGYEIKKEVNNGIESAYLVKRVLLMEGTNGDQTTNYLRTSIKKEDIESLTFANSIGNHTVNGSDCFDVSLDENGTVLAWVTDNDSNGKYEMTIGADGVVYASSGANLFYDLRNLNSLNGMNNFDTTNVTDMSSMFSNTGYNSTVFTLDLGDKFDTSNVTNMRYMFSSAGASNTSFTLDLGDNFDTANVTNMSGMFSSTGYSSTVFTLDLGDKFDTTNVTNMINMFYNTGYNSTVFTLDLGDKFDTTNVTNMNYMFYNTGRNSTVFTLDLGDEFDTTNVTNMGYMFSSTGRNSTVFTLDLGDKFDTSKVKYMGYMFSSTGYSSTVFTLDLGDKFDTLKVTEMSDMFYNTGRNSTVFTLDLGDKFDTSNVTNMSNMFSSTGYYSTVFTLDLGDKFDTTNVTNMQRMFSFTGYNSTAFTLDLGDKFDTTNVTNMSYMFSSTGYNSTAFTLDLGDKFDTTNVINMIEMFRNARKIKTIYAPSSFVTANVTDSTNMFYGCTSLVGGAGTTYNTSNPSDKTYAHIDGGVSNPGYFTGRGALIATFYYNSNTTNGSLTVSSTVNSCVPASGQSSCTVTVPSIVSSSVGQYNSAYKGVSTSTGNMNSSSLTISSDTTFYANYSTPITIYYPDSLSTRTSATYYKNEWFDSNSSMARTITNNQNSTTEHEFEESYNNYELFGFATSPSTNTTPYEYFINLYDAPETTFYAVLFDTVLATIYYNNGTTAGSVLFADTTLSLSQYLRCTSTGAEISNSSAEIPSNVTGSVGKYLSAYKGLATSPESMATVNPTSANTTYYATYSSPITNYYYNETEYSSRTLYRNEFFESGNDITVVLNSSNTDTTDYQTATGPGSSVWTGLSTGQDTTTEYSSVASAATSTSTTLYTVYQFNINYLLGSNVASIGANSDSCKVTANDTTCFVVLPVITPNAGYESVGWSTTSGATTGISSGQNYTLNTNPTTLYANAKTTNYINTTTNTYYATLNDAFSAVQNNQTIKALKDVTETTNATLASGKTGIKLDLNGKIVTMSSTYIVNNGELDIYNSSSADGKITGGTLQIISNNGELTLNATSTTNKVVISLNTTLTRGIEAIMNEQSASLSIYDNVEIKLDSSNIPAFTAIVNDGITTISGGTINGEFSGIDNRGTVIMTGGSITGITGIICLGTNSQNVNATITGGTITGSNNGIDLYEGSTLTVGTNDSSVSTSSPVIEATGLSNSYAVRREESDTLPVFNFYDGIIKSSSGSAYTFSGTPTDRPPLYLVRKELINGIGIAYLSKTVKATFYYNSNATYDGLTVSSTTATCITDSTGSCTVTVPSVVSNSVGLYNTPYKSVANQISNMNSSSLTISNDTTFYANYSMPVTIYYPISTTARSSTIYYKNEYFMNDGEVAPTRMASVIAANDTTKTNMTFTPSVSGYDLYGFANSTGTNTYDFESVAALARTQQSSAYAILRKGKTATIYYNSGTGDGTLSATTATTATAYQYIRCTDTAAQINNTNYTVPASVSSSKGKYGSAYKGVSTATSSMATATPTTANDTFYATYSGNITIYYPSSTSARSSYAYKRNEFFTSTTAMNSVIAANNTTTTNFTFNSSVSGYSLYGFANAASNNTRNYSSVAALATSVQTISYAILRVGKTATVYYNSGSGNGTLTVATATTNTAYQYLRCTDTAAEISNNNYTIPSAVTSSVGQYGNTYVNTAGAVNTMTAARTTAYTTLYAFYRDNNVTNYYYSSSAYTSRTLYRNNMFTSTTAMKTILNGSSGSISNYGTATGPGSSVWTGLSTGADTTTEYSSVASAATSNSTTLYTVYTMNVTYEKGDHVNSIGATTGSCKVTTSSTACNVTLPSITPASGYISAGWSTTKNATSGTSAGSNYSVSSNNTKLYGNAKENYTTMSFGSASGSGQWAIGYTSAVSVPSGYRSPSKIEITWTTATITPSGNENLVVAAQYKTSSNTNWTYFTLDGGSTTLHYGAGKYVGAGIYNYTGTIAVTNIPSNITSIRLVVYSNANAYANATVSLSSGSAKLWGS